MNRREHRGIVRALCGKEAMEECDVPSDKLWLWVQGIKGFVHLNYSPTMSQMSQRYLIVGFAAFFDCRHALS